MSPDTLRIDKTIPDIGRIARASGTTDKRTYKAILAMLDTLRATGRLDLLRQLRDGLLSAMTLYDAFRRGALDELPTTETSGRLIPAMRAWVDALTDNDAVPEHRRGLSHAIDRLERANPKATVHQAADTLQAVRTAYAKHPRAFNLTRSALQAFLRDTLTKAHPVYHQVAAVPGRRAKAVRKARPLTPDEMRAQFPNPASDPVDAIAWTMATTGMGPGELWGAWSVKADRVRIEGTKREGRKREVPLVIQPTRPTISRKAFEQRLKRRAGTEVRPYDFRRTYANWLESAGVPRTRRVIYMGHSTVGDITGLYERHEVTAYLASDADRLRAHVQVPATRDSSTVRLRLVGGRDA